MDALARTLVLYSLARPMWLSKPPANTVITLTPPLPLPFACLHSLSHRQVVCRGLRVRMGMHCGISDPADVVYDPTTNQTTYSGNQQQAVDARHARVVDESGNTGAPSCHDERCKPQPQR